MTRLKMIGQGLAGALLILPTLGSAHVVFAEPSARAASYYAGFLRVSHGCAGSATISIRVQIPAGISVVRPQPTPGWILTTQTERLAAPIHGEGGDVRERVVAVTWTGHLPADQFDQFGLMLKLPDTTGMLYFPTVQRCERGQNDWTMVPAPGQPWHSVKSPAPVLDITKGDTVPMDHMHM